MSGAPLLPVAIHGTEHTLGVVNSGVHRTSVRLWFCEPLMWHDFADRIDPIGAMTESWRVEVDSHLARWRSDAGPMR